MKYYTKEKHKECITEMRDLFGDYAVYHFCVCNAYKYAYRAGLKENNPALMDYEKIKWYLAYANYIVRQHTLSIFGLKFHNPKYKPVSIDTVKEAI